MQRLREQCALCRRRGVGRLPWAGLLLVLVVLTACGSSYTYSIPSQTGDGWSTSSLEEVGIKEAKLAKLVDRINDGTYADVHSVLIARDGKLVFEEYFRGYTWNYDDPEFHGELVQFDAQRSHNLASVTKSVTSALLGIAIDQGAVGGVQDAVCDYFPAYAAACSHGKEALTLEHLLTMSSGLRWNEADLPYSDLNNDVVQLFIVDDPIGFVLSKPLDHQPGSTWYYNGGGTNVLAEVIHQATGQRMDEYAEQVLFGPLGITEVTWEYLPNDLVYASGNLRLRPRDMVKFGQLFLDGGEWQGQRLVSQEWVAASTAWRMDPGPGEGYGYQWWLFDADHGGETVRVYHASGWGGQQIMVLPALDMVVVFTGGNYTSNDPAYEILTRHILPAVE